MQRNRREHNFTGSSILRCISIKQNCGGFFKTFYGALCYLHLACEKYTVHEMGVWEGKVICSCHMVWFLSSLFREAHGVVFYLMAITRVHEPREEKAPHWCLLAQLRVLISSRGSMTPAVDVPGNLGLQRLYSLMGFCRPTGYRRSSVTGRSDP